MISPKQRARYIAKRLYRTRRAIRAQTSEATLKAWDRQLAHYAPLDRLRVMQHWARAYRVRFPPNARISYRFDPTNARLPYTINPI